MAEPVTVHLERADDAVWTYVHRSAGELPVTSLHSTLKWVLEQLNFGHFENEQDSSGDIVSMKIGRAAAMETVSDDQALESARSRLLAVNISGVFAGSRESGIEPQYAYMSKMLTQQTTDWGLRNTEFHYAFELVRVLARLNKKTFALDAPPIKGSAPASVISYLGESTRCWLYGFHGASVALSRACLEEALKAKVSAPNLEALIDAARQRQLLDACMADMANSIRKTANKFLHGQSISESESRETLDGTRSIVEEVFYP